MRHPDTIPAAPIIRIVQRYVKEYQAAIGAGPGEKDSVTTGTTAFYNDPYEGLHVDDFFFASAKEVLADEAGIRVDTVRKYVRGETRWIRFEIADALLAAMGLTHLWHADDELRELYYGANVSGEDICGRGHRNPSRDNTNHCRECRKQDRLRARLRAAAA